MSRFDRIEIRDRVTPEKFADDPGAESGATRDDEDYRRMGDKALAGGDPETALRYFSRALGMKPTNAAAWIGQLRCLLSLGEFDEVDVWSDRALATLPDHPGVLSVRAVALGRKGERGRAIGLSDLAIKAARDVDWFCWWARGDVLLGSNVDNARYCFEKARETAGDDQAAVLFETGRSYLSADAFSEAVHYLARAEAASDRNPAVAYHHAIALGMTGRRRPACEAAARCMNLRPPGTLRDEAEELLGILGGRFFVRRRVRAWLEKKGRI